MDLAVFGQAGGNLVVGEGPFEARDEPPREGVAFYRNDFALSSGSPWWIPARVRELAPGEDIPGSGAEAPDASWVEPNVEPFAQVFGEVSKAIKGGMIEKSVPVVTACGKVIRGEASGLLRGLQRVEDPLRAYGWVDGVEGVAGLSPELLFRIDGLKLQTMALAGTARREEMAAFAMDEKEIREHEFVAQTLLAKLSDLGVTNRHQREIMDLGRLVHFHSGIDVELEREIPLNRLVRALHPTPALGPLPRTAQTLEQLQEWREALDCPPGFGAPFGMWKDGRFEVLVAIRMVSWNGSDLQIPSGCGVIEESRIVNEWRELRLKREAVRASFGL